MNKISEKFVRPVTALPCQFARLSTKNVSFVLLFNDTACFGVKNRFLFFSRVLRLRLGGLTYMLFPSVPWLWKVGFGSS